MRENPPTSFDRLEADLADRGDAILERTRRLVEQNSFTSSPEGGKIVARMLEEELAAVPGISVRTLPSERFAPHLVASSRAAEHASEGCIAIVGHLDTVFPPGSFEGFRRDGELARGPGVLDMKGGLSLAIEALASLARIGELDRIPVRFVIVSDEEVGSPEGKDVLERTLAGARAALVLEAGRAGDAIITARKGTASARAVARGKAAHAGNAHDQGANAIWALARFVDRAQRLTDYARGVTVNVGTIRGGESKNTVPDEADALLDFRFTKMADATATFDALVEAARAASDEITGTSVVVTRGHGRTPLERTPENVALLRAYAACATRAGLGAAEASLLGGGSDASTTAAMGIASIDGLGPRGAGFHTKEERIEVSSLVPKALALALFLAETFPPSH